MSEVFGHKYELYVRQPTELLEVVNGTTGYEGNVLALVKGKLKTVTPDYSKYSGSTGNSDYLTVDVGSLLIKNPIQMDADVKYSSGVSTSTPQMATIRLFNLSENTIAQIGKDYAILLKAGWDTDNKLPITFVGTIDKVSTKREGANKVTEIVCKEGGTVLSSATYSKSFPEGEKYQYVFLDLMQKFADCGIPTGLFLGNDKTTQGLGEPLKLSGLLSKQLTLLCDMLDYVWFISGGKLYVQPKNEDRYLDIVQVSASNALSISKHDDNKGASSVVSQAAPAGVELVVFLNTEIRLETYVEILDGDYKGVYKPTEIKHKLNWHSGPWQTTLTCQAANTFELQRG